MGQALQVEQENGLALALGELGHGRADPRGEFGQFRALIRARLIRHRLGPHSVGAAGGQFGPQLTQPAPGHVQRDAAEPGAEPVRRTQPAQVGHGRDAGFLGGVPGQVGRPEQPGRERHRGRPMTGDQLGEGALVAAQGRLHKFRVRPRVAATAMHTS